MKKIISIIAVLSTMLILAGCGKTESAYNDLKGSITGNTYDCSFYTNSGELFMTASGTNIDLEENIVKEKTYSSEGGWGYTKTLSSVITITIDGHQMESCGSTILFAENTLEPDVNFTVTDIKSEADSFADNVFISKIINRYDNAFGKPVIVLIQSQLGDPICAYSGQEVYWEVCQDLPKTTKLMIDGKALYIHRANFQIIDKALLDS